MLKMLDKLFALFRKPAAPPSPDERLRAAGERAVAEGLRLWHADIIEVPRDRANWTMYADDAKAIDRTIRTPAGLGWHWQKPYAKDGDFQWCGAFVAACWAAAGLKLKPHRYTFFASTLRLDKWRKGEAWNDVAAGPPRLSIVLNQNSKPEDCVFPDGTLPRAGDIVLVGDGNPAPGDHICLCVAYDSARGIFETVEGNGTGMGPDGMKRQGVVKATRRVGGTGYCVRRVIRPSLGDLE